MEPVRIRQLRLRAREADRSAALTALERAGWPDGGRDWVLVRRLHVRAPRPWLGLRASADARRVVAAAVPAGAAGADDAPAVRFASRAELLAHLGADLLAGTAHARWYWQAWQALLRLPPQQAAARLWAGEIEQLAAVTAMLAATDRLEAAWARLGGDAARRILERLAEQTGLAGLARTDPAPVDRSVPLPLPSFVVRRWTAPLRGLPDDAPALRLAAALALLEVRPTALIQNPETALRAAAITLRESRPEPPHTGQPGARQPEEALRRMTPPASPRPDGGATAPGETGHPASPGTDGSRSVPERRPGPTRAPAAEWPASRRHEAGGTEPSAAAPWSPARPEVPGARHSRAPGEAESGQPATLSPLTGAVHSRQAGTLFLINALRRPEALRVVEDHGGWDALPGGWAWLYRLGRELDLDANDPLVAVMASQLGLERVADLEDLPALPGGDRLPAVLAGVYQDLWEPALIRTAGEITYTPSHVDAHLPMTAVRLPVRAAGLDVNPGWVPWLGRVVNFHYRDREPGR